MERPATGRASVAQPHRILVVRLGAIGDCLRVLPSLSRLREAFPAAEIGWVVSDLAAPLLDGHPAITRLHLVNRRATKAGFLPGWQELRRVGAELAAERYDVAIDFHTRFKSGYLTRASRARRRIGFDRASGTEANFLFTNCHVNLSDRYENRVTRLARLLAPLGVDTDVAAASRGLWVAPDVSARARAMYEEAGRPAVAIFPGTSASRSFDRWPQARWRRTVERLGEAGITT
ncbi:MAG: glycosyltransferase family 9 protein, partial [Candidatus Binatia bacterium]